MSKNTHLFEAAPPRMPRLADTFSLLCWNVHKEMGQHRFNAAMHTLLEEYAPDLLLLQEAVLDHATARLLPHYSYAAAVNIGMRRKSFGVLTAAGTSFNTVKALRTVRRELRMATRKSLLITAHPLGDGTELTLVNIHAINFVSASAFFHEMQRLLSELRGIDGPLIVAGDFNTWSRKRLAHLDDFAAEIDLRPAPLEEPHHIKHLFAKPLDHLYYRGLELLEARAFDTAEISDHNPLYARFRH